jgi:multidrug resistance efflux pump
MKKMTLWITTIVVLAFVLTACSSQAAETPATPSPESASNLISEGRLYPVDSLDHSFNLSGQVAEVLVQNGDTVEAGQPLARLESSAEIALALARAQQETLAAQQALDALNTNAAINLANSRLALIRAQAELDDAQARLEDEDSEENQALLELAQANLALAKQTQEELLTGNGVNQDELTAVAARLVSAQTAIKSAQAGMEALTLKANRAGTIVDLSLLPGQKVAGGAPVVTVADFSGWLVKTDNLTEIDVVNLAVGQKVEVVLDALPEVTLAGEVTQINARFEEKRGDITYTVTIRLSQMDPRMRWGMTAAVSFLP